jgi:predicted nucleic acid-binding protein
LIFLDTNVISETLRPRPDPNVLEWLVRHDSEIALSTVVIAELAFGIHKLRADRRSKRLRHGLDAWRKRFAGRIHAFTEDAALIYGQIMGKRARIGRPLSAQDGMIAAIASEHACALATRNVRDFGDTGIEVVNPWD